MPKNIKACKQDTQLNEKKRTLGVGEKNGNRHGKEASPPTPMHIVHYNHTEGSENFRSRARDTSMWWYVEVKPYGSDTSSSEDVLVRFRSISEARAFVQGVAPNGRGDFACIVSEDAARKGYDLSRFERDPIPYPAYGRAREDAGAVVRAIPRREGFGFPACQHQGNGNFRQASLPTKRQAHKHESPKA